MTEVSQGRGGALVASGPGGRELVVPGPVVDLCLGAVAGTCGADFDVAALAAAHGVKAAPMAAVCAWLAGAGLVRDRSHDHGHGAWLALREPAWGHTPGTLRKAAEAGAPRP